MPRILAELTPLDTVAGTRVTLRAASSDDPQITGLNDQRWWPAIPSDGMPTLTMRLFDGDFTSDVDTGGASFAVLIDKLARLDANARRFLWAGAGVKLWAGESGAAWGAWTQIFDGKVERFSAEANRVGLQARVNTEPFEKPVLIATYAGTGGIEGGADLKNKPKPWVFGRALNVEPVLIDAVNSVFQFSAYGPIQAINALYERASDFGASIGDYASYAALVAATIPRGRWGTCLASGLVRLGAPPYGVVTGDVDGDKPSGIWLRKTGEIISRIATNAGISSGLIDSASLAALDAAVPYNVNIVVDEQASVLDLARRLAKPCNAQAGISLLGKLFAVRVAIGSPALTLDAQGRRLPAVISSAEADVSPPYWRIEMAAQRSWRVHTYDEIATEAALVDRGAYSGTETYREGNIVQDQDSTWLYTNPTATAGNAPPTLPTTSNAYWKVLAKVGPTGSTGAAGLSVAEITIYKRSASAPATPSGGTYDFATKTLTSIPSGWSDVPPAGTDPLYAAKGVASVQGTTGTATPAWAGVGKIAQDGSDGSNGTNGTNGSNGADGTGVDVIFTRSAVQPATPAASTGTPSGWYSDVASVPAGSDPLWSSFGQRANSTANYSWDAPARVEGTTTLSLVAFGSGATVSANSVVMATSQGSHSNGAYSRESYVEGFLLEFAPVGASGSPTVSDTVIGVADASVAAGTHTNILFGVNCAPAGTIGRYNSGSYLSIGSWVAGDRIRITGNGLQVRYYKIGATGTVTLLDTVARTDAGTSFRAQVNARFAETGAKNIVFVPAMRGEDKADVTYTFAGPPSSEVVAKADGTFDTGVLAAGAQAGTVTSGGADVTSTMTFAYSVKSGTGTASVALSNGKAVLTPLTLPETSVFEVTASLGGTVRAKWIHTMKKTLAAGTSGSTGSGSGTSASGPISGSSNSTTPVALTGIITVKAGANGQIACNAASEYVRQETTSGNATGAAVWRWRAVGGSFADITTAVTGTAAVTVPGDPQEAGVVSCNMTKTGLTNGTDYELQLYGYRTSGTGTLSFYGQGGASATCTGT